MLAAAAVAAAPGLSALQVEDVPSAGPATAVDVRSLGVLRDGDVIFLSAPDALWARMASAWSLPRYGHGHVGMIALDRVGRPLVVHASGDPTRRTATVRAVTVEKFLEEATAASVFRMRDAGRASIAARLAMAEARRGTPFDTEFSLDNGERLYCSELVWKAMSGALGRDVVPRKAWAYARRVVRLSDLESSPDLRLVARAGPPL